MPTGYICLLLLGARVRACHCSSAPRTGAIAWVHRHCGHIGEEEREVAGFVKQVQEDVCCIAYVFLHLLHETVFMMAAIEVCAVRLTLHSDSDVSYRAIPWKGAHISADTDARCTSIRRRPENGPNTNVHSM